LFSDIVGYTALMAESEARGLRARERHRDLLRPLAARYHGKVVDESGDELLLVFPSDLDAVNCALAAQAALRDDSELTLRIGIHAGDVVFEGGRVYGDGVNVASTSRRSRSASSSSSTLRIPWPSTPSREVPASPPGWPSWVAPPRFAGPCWP
jgi:hypothetical protein